MSSPAAAFRRLHHADRPLFLPNAWDVASGAALARDGYPAIGTTSLGVAAAAGKPDAAAATRDETVALARTLGRLPVLLTVDVEGGYSDDPDAVADLAAELAAAGAVGINVEDGRPDGGLADPGRHAAKVAAAKARCPDLFVNARTDTYWLAGHASLADTLARARAYVAAGADGIFVPGAPDDVLDALVAGVGAPLNVLYRPGSSLAALGRRGVARVSTGSLLFRVALGAALRTAGAIRRDDGTRGDDGTGGDDGMGTAPSYAEVQRLTDG